MSKPTVRFLINIRWFVSARSLSSRVCRKLFTGKRNRFRMNGLNRRLAISGFSREEHLTFDEPKDVMQEFDEWIKQNSNGQAVFISDNPAFDWQWINYYFHFFLGKKSVRFQREKNRRFVCRFGKRLFRRFKMEKV